MIKNYTSTVAVSRSVNHIEDRLMTAGAHQILKQYEDRKLVGIAFNISMDGKEMPFRLPARIKNVQKMLQSRVKRAKSAAKGRRSTQQVVEEQAERTAWKLLSDWVDIQMSLVELDQAQFLEVFLPYFYNPQKQQTFFERLKKDDFKQLTYSGDK